jgi:hypothetical protein
MKTFWLLLNVLWLGAWFVCGARSLAGCVLPSSAGDAGTTTIPAVGDGGALSGSATGTGCGTDPATGVTLCVGTSECPSVIVDPTVFPECGFYISGGVIYLACLCSDELCPIGQPATCDQAASLLQSTNEGTVCGAASNGGCTLIPTAPGSASAGAGATTSEAGSGCDTTCESACAGEPDCIQQCGC